MTESEPSAMPYLVPAVRCSSQKRLDKAYKKLKNEDDDEHAAKLALCLAKANALLHSAEKEDISYAAMQSTYKLQQALCKNELGEIDKNWVGTRRVLPYPVSVGTRRVLRNRIVHYN